MVPPFGNGSDDHDTMDVIRPDSHRVILHADLDAFYAQVESLRLHLDPSVPLAVRQWNRVIAVNYAARPLGVRRQMHVQEVHKLSGGQCRLPHVPTYDIATIHQVKELSSDEVIDAKVELHGYRYHDDDVGPMDPQPLQDAHKISLDPYRHASQLIWRTVIRALNDLQSTTAASNGASASAYSSSTPMLERASIDEAYIDVTNLVDQLLCINAENASVENDWTVAGLPPSNCCPPTADASIALGSGDTRVWHGCQIATHIRTVLKSSIGYTVSIGIAHNKTLAKLASAMHKPNQQTYVLARYVKEVMRQAPLEGLRFLGGKLGQAVTASFDDEQREDAGEDFREEEQEGANVMMASDVRELSIEELSGRVGDRESARWIYAIVRGHDPSSVTPRMAAKSLLSSKSFYPPLADWDRLEAWCAVMATELWSRVRDDVIGLGNARWPQVINMHFVRSDASTSWANNGRSRTTAFPILSLRHLDKPVAFLTDTIQRWCRKERRAGILDVPLGYFQLGLGRFAGVGNLAEWLRTRNAGIGRWVQQRKEGDTPDDELAFGQPLLPAIHVPPPKQEKPLKKKRTLASHQLDKAQSRLPFVTSPLASILGSEGVGWSCSECSFTLPVDDGNLVQEHMDYHIALRLSMHRDNGV